MRPRFATLVLLLILPAIVAVLSPAAPAHAIANGQDVAEGRYPFAVKLTMTGIPTGNGRRNSSCTGALIAPRWVITAGHCFRTANNVYVSRTVAKLTTATVGRTDLTGDGGHKVKVIAVKQSPTTDVSLAKLEEPITDIPFAMLSRKAPKTGSIVRLAGYGLTKDKNQKSLATVMQTGQFKVVSKTRGYLGMKGFAPEKNTSACEHDSGGPYFTQKPDGTAVLVSVVSRGPDCPHSGVDLSGRIDPIISWITGVVGKLPAAPTPPPSPSAKPRASVAPLAGKTNLASNPSTAPQNNTLIRTAFAALVILGVGGVLVLTLTRGRKRKRAYEGSNVRSHRR